MTRQEALDYVAGACCAIDEAKRLEKVRPILDSYIKQLYDHNKVHLQALRYGDWFIVPNGKVVYVKINTQHLELIGTYGATINGSVVRFGLSHMVIPISQKELHRLIDDNSKWRATRCRSGDMNRVFAILYGEMPRPVIKLSELRLGDWFQVPTKDKIYIKLNHKSQPRLDHHKAYGVTLDGEIVPFDEHYRVVYVRREHENLAR